tara:strand:- start:142 stop:645 length:504 start_codon:yes stop_codon:yes gene_type:complete
MRKVILSLLIVLLSIGVYAESSKVYIVAFSYENGELTFDDKVVKYGYSPDRKLTEGDYRGEVVSADSVLYDFDFNVPLTEFVDISDVETGELSGGIVKVDSTRFALVLPYFEEAKSIEIYDPSDTKVMGIDVEEKKESNLLLIIGIAIVLLIVILLLKKKPQRKLYK